MTTPITEFRAFAEKSDRILRLKRHSPNVSCFLEFVHEAERVVIPSPAVAPTIAFNSFVTAAMPAVIGRIRRLMPRLAARAVQAKSWLTPHDLLSVAGFSFVENSYTALMKWALDPATHAESAIRRQQAWLSSLGIGESFCGSGACVVRAQVVTEDGIPDLVFEYPAAVVVVEAKTGSTEHSTPSGAFQTIAYGEELRRLAPGKEVIVVFITPGGKSAANPEAINTTFVDFAFVLADALSTVQLPDDTRAAFRLLFTHFLTCAITSNLPVREIIERVSAWSQGPDWQGGDAILARMTYLLNAAEILIPEHTR